MKSKDLDQARKLCRAALGATYRIHNLRVAIDKFLMLDENNEIHIGEEDTLVVEKLQEDVTEAVNAIMSIIDEGLPAALGIRLIDPDDEISIDREYREYRARELVGSERGAA